MDDAELEVQEEVLATVLTDLQNQVRDLTAELASLRDGSRELLVAATKFGNVIEDQKKEIARLRSDVDALRKATLRLTGEAWTWSPGDQVRTVGVPVSSLTRLRNAARLDSDGKVIDG